jgi:hypothetical protein
VKRWKLWRRALVLAAVMVAAAAVMVGSSSAMNAGAVSAGHAHTLAPMFCACGGGGLPYCDAGELGVQLYATWIVWFALPPSGYSWQTHVFQCEYNSAAAVARSWTIQVGLDPNSGPGKFWLIA